MKFNEKQRKEVRKSVNNLLSADFNTCSCLTDTGILVAGSREEAIAAMGLMVNHLKFIAKFTDDEILKVAKLAMNEKFSDMMGGNQYKKVTEGFIPSKTDKEVNEEWDEEDLDKLLKDCLKEVKKMLKDEE